MGLWDDLHDEFDRWVIGSALAATGSYAGAARMLDVSRRRLTYRARQLGIEPLGIPYAIDAEQDDDDDPA